MYFITISLKNDVNALKMQHLANPGEKFFHTHGNSKGFQHVITVNIAHEVYHAHERYNFLHDRNPLQWSRAALQRIEWINVSLADLKRRSIWATQLANATSLFLASILQDHAGDQRYSEYLHYSDLSTATTNYNNPNRTHGYTSKCVAKLSKLPSCRNIGKGRHKLITCR